MTSGEKNNSFTQITYFADGTQKVFCGKNCWVEFDFPPSALTRITIKEKRTPNEIEHNKK